MPRRLGPPARAPAAGPNAAREHELSAGKSGASGRNPTSASHAHVSPRRVLIIAAVVVAVAAAGYFGFPIVSLALNTVSTDDAYVNGHVTFIAASRAGPGR